MIRENWSFSAYIEEIFALSEINEIPGIKQKIAELIREVWSKFPNECKHLGLHDGQEKSA
jgi:hypothetical protein